jgi:outer membrane protein TolC
MKCFRLYISVSLFILLATGCIAVGPSYKRPSVKIAKNWLDAEKQGVLKETKEYRYWWRVFKDTCLDKLIETAYRENLTLRIAGVRVLEAHNPCTG